MNLKDYRHTTINFKNRFYLTNSCVGSIVVIIRRCQRWGPGPIPGPRIHTLWSFRAMSGVCFGGGGVDSDYDDLQYSDDDGRVVVFDAFGVASET